MALPEMDATCTTCGACQRGKPTRSFLGFQKLTCQNCKADFLYPLTDGFRIFYWIFVVLGVVSAVVIIGGGSLPMPSIWLLLIGIALVRDRMISKQVAAAKAKNAQSSSLPPAAGPDEQ